MNQPSSERAGTTNSLARQLASFFKSIHQHPHAFVQTAVRAVDNVDAVVSVFEMFQNRNKASRRGLFFYNKQREADYPGVL